MRLLAYVPMPGPGNDNDEISCDKQLKEPQPKLRYDGDSEDQD